MLHCGSALLYYLASLVANRSHLGYLLRVLSVFRERYSIGNIDLSLDRQNTGEISISG